MNLNAIELAECWTIPLGTSSLWADAIDGALMTFEINTIERLANFVAQTGHESGRGKWVREIWGPTQTQLGYEGRKDLGNIHPGDGKRFLGRGLIQLTGRANYAAARDGMQQHYPTVPDFESLPTLLEMPRWAAYSAAWFWKRHGLNELADSGDQQAICRRINGGLNGLTERIALYKTAIRVLEEKSEPTHSSFMETVPGRM